MSETFTFSSAIASFVIGHSPIERSLAPSIVPAPPTSPDIERLYDNVQMLLPSVTLPVIEMELWNTVQEFCIVSTYFRSKIYWEMGRGVSSVDFNPFDANTVVVWVLAVHGLTHWEINPPAQLVDFLPPHAARSGWAMVALRPVVFDVVKLGALPELFTTWFETMHDGVLFRMFGMPAKPWSSPQLAQYHGTRFRQGMNRARDIAERLHSNQQSPFRMYPYFARGRRKQ
jgi:hypothetical protein